MLLTGMCQEKFSVLMDVFWYTLFDNLQIIIYNYYIYMMDTFRLIYLVNSTHTV